MGGPPSHSPIWFPPRPPPGYFPPMCGAPGPSGLGALHWLHSLRHEKFIFSQALPRDGAISVAFFLCSFYPVLVVFCPKKTLTGWGTSSPPRAAALRLRWGSRLGCLLRNRRRRRTPRVPSGLGEQRVGFWGEKGRFWGSPKKGSRDLGLTSPPAASPPAAAAAVEVGSPGGEGNLDGVAGEFFA